MPTARSLSLTAFLMTPVQRIPRYKMLLEDLFKNTPSTHPDFEDLEKAIVLIQGIASSVNEHIRDHEMVLKMLDLQRSIQGLGENLVAPGRRFLKRGPVLKVFFISLQNSIYTTSNALHHFIYTRYPEDLISHENYCCLPTCSSMQVTAD